MDGLKIDIVECGVAGKLHQGINRIDKGGRHHSMKTSIYQIIWTIIEFAVICFDNSEEFESRISQSLKGKMNALVLTWW